MQQPTWTVDICTLLAHYKDKLLFVGSASSAGWLSKCYWCQNFESLNIIAIKMKIINRNISSIKMFLMPIKMSVISKPVICGSLKRCFCLLQRDDKDEDDD